MLWIFGKVSNQAEISRIRNIIRGNLIGVRLFQNDLNIVLRLQGRIMLDTLRYMKYSLIPMVIMMGPVILIIVQLHHNFNSRPLKPGETAVVKVMVRDGSVLKNPVTLEAPEGVTVETPGVRIEREGEVDWRIRADREGRYKLTIKIGEETVEKDLIVGEGWGAMTILRPGKNALEVLLYPGENPLDASMNIQSVQVGYPTLDIGFLGWNVNWLIFFFFASIAFGFAFKGVLGVEI